MCVIVYKKLHSFLFKTSVRLVFSLVVAAAQSKTYVCGRSLAGIAVHGCLSVVSVVCCAGRGLCEGLITRRRASPTDCVASLCVI